MCIIDNKYIKVKIIGKNINNYIKSHYSNSTLKRKMLTSGNENYTSASDLAKLLKNIQISIFQFVIVWWSDHWSQL